MQSVKDRVKRYWDWRSESYAQEYACELEKGPWGPVFRELAKGAHGHAVLDVGTGSGLLAICLAKAGCRVTAVDLSEKMLALARERALAEGVDVCFRPGDAEDLAFEDRSFDIVVSRNLLWTLPDPQKALGEWRRVLKPGGRLVVSDGFWQNYTWKRAHRFMAKVVARVLSRDNWTLPFRFWQSYARARQSLPFYEGIRFEQASRLLRELGYRNIVRYDLLLRREYFPSTGNTSSPLAPPFFIARAVR